MKYIKYLLICLLFTPCFVFAVSYSESVEYINNLNKNGDAFFVDNSYELLSKNEFNKTKVSDESISSYLYSGLDYWVKDNSGKSLFESSDQSLIYTRSTVKVKNTVVAGGSGTYSDPWYFKNSFGISLNAYGNGNLSTSNGSTANKTKSLDIEYYFGEEKTFYAIPDAGYSYIYNTCPDYIKEENNNLLTIKNVSNNLNCYVYFAKKGIPIIYDANGGSGEPAVQLKVEDVDIVLSTEIPTRTNYDFKGWSTVKDGPVVYNPGDTYSSNDEITLYAVWYTETYTISYDLNGGSGTFNVQTKKKNETINLYNYEPTMNGGTFLGWSIIKNGNTVYSKGDTYSTNANLVLYAKWDYSTYTVDYDLNGGNGSIAQQTKYKDQTLTLSSTTPTRKGCEFLGWSTTKNGETLYQPSGDFTENANTTLYAKWKIGPTAENVDYASISSIKVLNIYPYKGDYLSTWLSGNSTFNVTSVSLADFNTYYSTTLIQDSSTGKWNYDVIVFGFSDCNGYCDGTKNGHTNDLTSDSSKYVETFITSGNPVLFGHDTLAYSKNFTNTYFNYLGSKYLGVTTTSRGTTKSGVTTVLQTTEGLFFNEVNKLEPDKGKVETLFLGIKILSARYTVPETHSSYGMIIRESDEDYVTEWLMFASGLLVFDVDDSYLPYLFSYGKDDINTAFINTGAAINVSGKGKACTNDVCSTDAEKKIIENIIYYLYARSHGIS